MWGCGGCGFFLDEAVKVFTLAACRSAGNEACQPTGGMEALLGPLVGRSTWAGNVGGR